MKRDMDQWSLVIAGRWNTAILSPAWLAKEVFKQADIGIMFPVLGFGPTIFQAEDIKIIVSNDSVTFIPQKDSDELLARIEDAGRHILDTLHHTPIIAFGENFHYIVEGLPSQLADVLKFTDTEQLSTQGKIGEISLIRTINLDSCQLNLKIVSDGSCRIELNYHYMTKPSLETAAAMAKIMENTYIKNRDHGLKLLENVYKLSLDEDENHDNNASA
ncbi:MAG: hypothetical protein ABSG67_03660 [Thermoguttaceae bacterium]|jgi:hypothetical protein